jgi:hypothetical protein
MDLVEVKKYIVVGVKILTFVASGISVYLGIKELTTKPNQVALPNPPTNFPSQQSIENCGNMLQGPSETQQPAQQMQSQPNGTDVIMGDTGLSQKGRKVIEVLAIISSVCLGIFEVVKSLGTVTDSVDRLFKKDRYTSAGIGRGGYIPGNYPWNTPERMGYPNNVPIYRGPNGNQGSTYWIQRNEGITEIW